MSAHGRRATSGPGAVQEHTSVSTAAPLRPAFRAAKAAVRRAAEELGYRPNVAARALRTGVARTVGLVVPDVTNPFFGRVLRGAQVAAWKEGYAVILADAGND